MKIKTVTITGADDNTDIDYLMEIHRNYPFIEFGILFSPSRHGTSRYPSLEWVEKLMKSCLSHNCMDYDNKPKLSAHLCGNYTYEYLNKGHLTSALKDLGKIMSGIAFHRYQLNFNSTKNPACEEFFDSLGRCTTNQILQFNKANYDLCQKVIEIKNPNIHFLHDGSGGRGVLPEQWKGVVPNHFTGYAGGLNPDNLNEALIKINEAVGDNEIWIDAETGVRTDDKLDLEKVFKFLEIAKKYV